MSQSVARCSWLPWARVNLCRNPFGELTAKERAETAVVDVDWFMSMLQRQSTAVQFIGDCGRGKTTRMLAIHSQIPDSSYVYLPENQPCPAIPEGNPVMIDEAQRLPRFVRRRVFATGLPLVLATHNDLTRSLRRHGYQVHTQHIGEGNVPELVWQLVNRRIEASRLAPGPIPNATVEDARVLVQRFGTNVRSIEHYLYDRFQSQVTGNGELRFVD
ncbi:MAG: hypothetical protein ACR2NZ_08520 [Rubripirellula sp.]